MNMRSKLVNSQQNFNLKNFNSRKPMDIFFSKLRTFSLQYVQGVKFLFFLGLKHVDFTKKANGSKEDYLEQYSKEIPFFLSFEMNLISA